MRRARSGRGVALCARRRRDGTIDRFRRGRGRGTDARSRGVGMSRRRAVGARTRPNMSTRRQALPRTAFAETPIRTSLFRRSWAPSHARRAGRIRAAPRVPSRRRARDAVPAGPSDSRRGRLATRRRGKAPSARRPGRADRPRGEARRRSEQWARGTRKIIWASIRLRANSLSSARGLWPARRGASRRSLAPPRAARGPFSDARLAVALLLEKQRWPRRLTPRYPQRVRLPPVPARSPASIRRSNLKFRDGGSVSRTPPPPGVRPVRGSAESSGASSPPAVLPRPDLSPPRFLLSQARGSHPSPRPGQLGHLLSSSRDKTVILWTLTREGRTATPSAPPRPLPLRPGRRHLRRRRVRALRLLGRHAGAVGPRVGQHHRRFVGHARASSPSPSPWTTARSSPARAMDDQALEHPRRVQVHDPGAGGPHRVVWSCSPPSPPTPSSSRAAGTSS